MTALDIIKVIITDDKLKMQILDTYEHMPKDKRSAIDYLAWTTYDEIYDERLQENLGMQYFNVKAGKEDIGDDYYARALKKTEEELEKEFTEGKATSDLSIARQAMEKIVREMAAAKHPLPSPDSLDD